MTRVLIPTVAPPPLAVGWPVPGFRNEFNLADMPRGARHGAA